MLLIFLASSDLMSAEHTSRFIQPFLRWLWPDVAPRTVATVQLAVRKAAHVGEYAVLAALLMRSVSGSRQHSARWRDALLVLCIAGSYAALDELHQSFVVSRTASIYDSIIDTAGGLVGLICYLMLARQPREAMRPRPTPL